MLSLSVIMHFLTYVFIPKHTDIQSEVARALRPFGAEFEVTPWKKYLDPEEIAAMARCYRVRKNAIRKLVLQMEDWNGGSGGVDEKGFFAILRCNPNARWDWYEIGGRWNGFLRGNVLSARTLLESSKLRELLPHDFLTPDGEWHQVETFVPAGWLDGHFERINTRQWLDEFRTALTTFADHEVVCVDRHM